MSRAKRGLLLAAVMGILGSFLPWLMSPLGNVSAMQGAGLWTLCASAAALGGAVMRSAKLVMVHAAGLGVVLLGLGGWQVARIVRVAIETQTYVLLPGMGLVMVVGGGVVAARVAWRLLR